MSVYTYTPGGTKFGDRIMALKPFMLEKGGQKYWNEFWTFVNRVVGAGVTLTGGRTTIGEIDMAATADVTTAVPRNWQDPMIQAVTATATAPQGRQMPGYSYPTTQIFTFSGFSG